MKINTYGDNEKDMDLVKLQSSYNDASGNAWSVYSGVDEGGIMCIVEMEIFSNPEPIWKSEDHPDIDETGNWVRQMRLESDRRLDGTH